MRSRASAIQCCGLLPTALLQRKPSDQSQKPLRDCGQNSEQNNTGRCRRPSSALQAMFGQSTGGLRPCWLEVSRVVRAQAHAVLSRRVGLRQSSRPRLCVTMTASSATELPFLKQVALEAAEMGSKVSKCRRGCTSLAVGLMQPTDTG